jgi:uncharacterized protein (TIGR02678 family)
MQPEEAQAQRRKALRALLLRPLLTAEHDADALLLVRRHLADLRDWLRRETGWRLHADAETARLFKTAPTGGDGTHPARGRAREPFGRRRYVVLCLALAVLERADAQITLGQLAEDVLEAVADPDLVAAGVAFTLENRAERGDLVAVVRMLLDWGALARVAGDEEAYLSANGDVLYDVRRTVLASVLGGVRGPSTIAAVTHDSRIEGLTAEPVADTDDLRNQALRQRLTRRLIEDPVVYHDELDDDERAYLTSQRHAITRRITEATGLIPEVRAEGIAMVDPDDELTDVRMPESRTDGHVTLLVAEHLAGRTAATMDELRAFVRQRAAEHTAYWRKGVTEPGAEDELLAIALDKLTALRLVSVGDDAVRARPAVDRFAIDEPTIHEPRDQERP